MELNEIMENQQEVIETAAEELTRSSGAGKAFKVAAGVGLTVLTGVVVYKFVIKPAVAKHKVIFSPADVVGQSTVVVDADVESDDAGEPEESTK